MGGWEERGLGLGEGGGEVKCFYFGGWGGSTA